MSRTGKARLHGEPTSLTRTLDGERLIAVFSRLIEPIGRSMPPTTEVLLHDLSLLPHSIVAIHGNVTGRTVGDPATDLLLKLVSEGADQRVGYRTTLSDGREIRSSTMIIRDVAGNPVAALCFNSDLSVWQTAQQIVEEMLAGLAGAEGTSTGAPPETFVRSIDELADQVMCTAIEKVGVPVELMHKSHKLDVVRDLQDHGMFLMKEGVDIVAARLQVSRFTIYNYLNEIREQQRPDISPSAD